MTNRHRALWSLPILVILSFLWYKRKRSGTSSDPGGTGGRSRQRGEGSSDEEDILRVLKPGGDTLNEVESVLRHVEVVSSEEEEEKPVPVKLPAEEPPVDTLSGLEVDVQEEIDDGEVHIVEHKVVDQKVVEDCAPKNGSADVHTPEEGCGEACQGLVDVLVDQCNENELVVQELCATENLPEVTVPWADQVVEEETVESSECPVQVDSRTKVGVVTAAECASEREETRVEKEELLLVGAMATDEDVRTDEKPTRDSANHSPAEVMLGSPSASSFSDEGSSDSGKGCSDVATPPSRTPVGGGSVSGDAPGPSVYEFVLPQALVGKLIGRHGAFVHQIKDKTNANVLIKRHPDTTKLKICAVEGSQMDIENALEMIRTKFPLKMFPSMTLEQVYFVPPVPTVPVLPDCLQFVPAAAASVCCSPFQWYPSCLEPLLILSLSLVEGVNNDVILSSLVSPSHFFLQQPTHPTFPSLNRLNTYMNVCYSEPAAPLLPTPVDVGIICVAPAMGGWFRAQVVATDPDREVYDVKFVDYGGYLSLEHSALRQIRGDFMTLPFQASECYLANVMPVEGGDVWSPEAMTAMEELTQGQVLQAQVLDYAQDGVPIVVLCAIHNGQVVLVNQELVNRGVAEWCGPVSEEEAA